jgi:hypothetical protein
VNFGALVSHNSMACTGPFQAIAGRPLQKAARAPPRLAGRRSGYKGGRLALAEAEVFRRDDLNEISVKESRKGSCTYRMAGARMIRRGRHGERREDRHRKSPPEGQGDEGRSSGDQALISRIQSNIHV